VAQPSIGQRLKRSSNAPLRFSDFYTLSRIENCVELIYNFANDI